MADVKQILEIKRNDLQPYFRFKVPDAQDLSQATFSCTMVHEKNKTVKISRATAGCFITNAVLGECEYRWQLGDTDTLGTYLIEFEFIPISGGKFTVPVKPTAYVKVLADLDGV